MKHSWLWHLFNDPMRDNPWSIVALVVMLGVFFVVYLWMWGDRR